MTFQIFAGQGVRVEGAYGVVQQVNEKEKLARVLFAGGLLSVYSYEELGPAGMDQDEFDELQAKIETYSEQRFSRTLIPVDSLESLNLHADYKVFPRTITAKVGLRMDIKIQTTLDSGLVVTGGKCQHGVYITSREQHENTARYCSLCHPYVIMAKSGIEYKA